MLFRTEEKIKDFLDKQELKVFITTKVLELQGDPTIGKDSDAGRGWGQEEKGTTEDEMAGWHH